MRYSPMAGLHRSLQHSLFASSLPSAPPTDISNARSPQVTFHDTTDSPRRPDLIADVRHVLRNSGYPELRSIDVKATARGVRLFGTVRSFYLKQVAQALATTAEGVIDVDNQMEVT
jgi:hypothetical protein